MTLALLLRFWWAPVILALCLACAVMAHLNDGLRDKLAMARAEANAAEVAAKTSEAQRKVDQAAATASYEGLQATCSAGIADAITKGRTIERLIYKPAPAGGGRAVIDAGELRQLLGQDPIAGDRPAGLPR